MVFYHRDPAPDGVGITVTSARWNLADGGPASDAEAFAALMGMPVVGVRQVHGRRAVTIHTAHPGFTVLDHEADALITPTRGIGLAVRTADCVPVLMADAEAGVIAAVHAGRAGVLNGVITEAIDAMTAQGARKVHAWVGPHICPQCYEVAPDMATDYANHLGLPLSTTSWGTPSIDLAAGIHHQLASANVTSETVPGCTLSDHRLHSYRRDGGTSGRVVSAIWLS